MPTSNGFSSIIVLVIGVILGALGLFIFQNFSKYSIQLPKATSLSETIGQEASVLVEKVKGSKYHSPDGTWWGYNQSKIVRHKDLVFTYYIDNDDDSSKTASRFVMMKKAGENPWEQGAIFPTSRPGNLLVDSRGVLHAFVFEPFNVSSNDSWGRILHYYFPDSAKGDIENYKKEIVVDNDGTLETANIRVGAAIGSDDTMVISFGLTKFNSLYKAQSEHIYFKKPDEEVWNHSFTDGLTSDFYYPFTLVAGNTVSLLPIQDDFTGQGNPNIYQKILFMQVKDGVWNQEMIVDLSNHDLAKSRPRLLEQEDLYLDKFGTIHILYKEFLDPENIFAATTHWHVKGSLGNFKKEQVKLDIPGVNWIRLLEVDGSLYYLVTTFGELFISPIENIKLTKINLPSDVSNNYPYISTPKSGSTNGDFVDVLLLGADKKLFKDGKNTNYYVKIPKSYFKP